MTWQEAMERFGSDKPDIRFGLELIELTEIFKSTEFRAFQAPCVKGIRVPGGAEWIIAGHTVTTRVDGKVFEQNHMIDAKINDGKVELFYVYAQDIPAKETTE